MSGGILTPDEWAAWLAAGRVVRYRRGAVVFREGDPPDRVLALRSGRVKVSLTTPGGREIVLAVKGPGDLLGELGALDGRPRSATATATEAAEAVALAPSAFNDFLDRHPRLASRLLRELVAELRASDDQHVERGSGDVTARVARRLVQLAERDGPELALSQDDLAGWVGASREATNRALSTLRARGCIATERRRIVVLDPALLADAAGGTGAG
jgi:CRP-like cAMP-binding protein